MKFLILFCLLSVFIFSIPGVLSYNNHRSRLFNLIRRPLGAKVNSLALTAQNDKGLSNQETNSAEYEDNIRSRDTWDSGEDYYFQWANQNRRPVEYLTGRKRTVGKVVLPSRDRRINGGLWRSGLVG